MSPTLIRFYARTLYKCTKYWHHIPSQYIISRNISRTTSYPLRTSTNIASVGVLWPRMKLWYRFCWARALQDIDPRPDQYGKQGIPLEKWLTAVSLHLPTSRLAALRCPKRLFEHFLDR